MLKPITPLPSIVQQSNGESATLSELSVPEQKMLNRGFCNNMSKAMSDYFTQNPDDWDAFVDSTGPEDVEPAS